MYEYNATLIKVVDGDTIDVMIDLGLHVHIKERLRLAGIDAPERYKPGGKEAIKHLTHLLIDRKSEHIQGPINLKIRTEKEGKYGRWIAWLYPADIELSTNINYLHSINKCMVEDGHAKWYQP